MCYKSLLCPLCCQTKFSNLDTFKRSLVKVTNRPLICPICNEILLGLDKFTIHIFGHSIMNNDDDDGDEDEIGAEIKTECNSFNNQSDIELIANGVKLPLTQHQQQLVHQQKLNKNSIFGKILKKKRKDDHLQNFTAPPYKHKCDICDVFFRSNDLLKMHENLLHNKIIVDNGLVKECKFQCHLCSKLFKMKGSLKVHLRVAHQGFHGHQNILNKRTVNGSSAISTDSLKSPTPSSSLSATSSYSDINKLCGSDDLQSESNDKCINILENRNEKTTSTSMNINQTIKQSTISPTSPHIPPSSITPMKLFSDNTLTHKNIFDNQNITGMERVEGGATIASNLSDQVKVWECDICAKSFTTKYFLKKHKRLHTGEMPYSCTICGKTFTFQQSYHKHLLYHSDEKPHICGNCGRAFKELSTLHNHERIHSGEKPFQCETCNKCFRQRVSYLVHRRIHTGVMPYKCTACNKSFRYKVSQRTHKCPSHPPGTVVRQAGDLLKKLFPLPNQLKMESEQPQFDLQHHNLATEENLQNPSPNQTDDSGTIFNGTSIDDILKTACPRLNFDNNVFASDVNDLFKNLESYNDSENTSSPTEKLQNMCLYSPTNTDETNINFENTLETINEDCLRKLLYGD